MSAFGTSWKKDKTEHGAIGQTVVVIMIGVSSVVINQAFIHCLYYIFTVVKSKRYVCQLNDTLFCFYISINLTNTIYG